MISLLQKFRNILLSPDSKLELWLRTQYHRLNQTRLFFKLQDWLAKRSYLRWRKYQDAQPLDDPASFDDQPKISFLLSYSSINKSKLLNTIESIQNLYGNQWEIILISEQTDTKADLTEEIYGDKRIKIFSSDPQDLFDFIDGEFIIFSRAGDWFFRGLLVHFYNCLSENNSADLYYYDCEYNNELTGETTPLFKPQSLSPALLLSHNYLSRGFVRSTFLENISSLQITNENLLRKEYELALRLCETEGSVRHISHVLVRQTNLVKPESPEIQRIIKIHLSRSGLEEAAAHPKSFGTRFTWRTGNPSVAIIIPTKNHQKLLKSCLYSIIDKTSYKNFSIHLIDNNSDDPKTLAYYQQIKSEPNINLHPFHEEFNYSKAINIGVSKSVSDLVLFLNDDIEIIESDWLTELVQWAVRPEIGVVGGKLIRSNHTIQHAGIIIGLHGFAGHIYLNAPEHYHGLFGSVDWYRDYLAVTGACQMVRREVFNQVGGYDEGYKIAFGDIDFCLRVHQAEYRNIYTPFASIFHYEGRSRGYITPKGDVLRGYKQMESALTNEDPYFSPNLSYTRIPKCVISEMTSEERVKMIELRKKFHEKQ